LKLETRFLRRNRVSSSQSESLLDSRIDRLWTAPNQPVLAGIEVFAIDGFCSILISFLLLQELDVDGGMTMSTGMESITFRSPLRKLVRFFEGSRDGWKAKYQKAKQLCKKLSNQVRAVEKSREHWRGVARQSQQQLEEVQRELEAIKSSAV
jgi:esterase/lipase